ncbi:MAG TPA: hypothetical protein VL101_12070, partial [Nordella sp.]|nr:hypothetical protein [Nordella sp.]
MARIVAGAGLHRRLDRSLRPVLRAIGASLGPDGRDVLYDKGGAVGRAVTGFAIAREMPIPEGPDGVAPRLLKEVLFAADRDWGDGTARLALIAGGCFSGGMREVTGGISQRPLCEAIRRLARQLSDVIDGERACETDLLAIARGAGAASAQAERFAALVTDLGSAAIFDVKENNGHGIEVTRSQGFVFDARTLGEEALSDLASVNVLVADEIIQDFGMLAPVLEG